jgi:hypothetical protein
MNRFVFKKANNDTGSSTSSSKPSSSNTSQSVSTIQKNTNSTLNLLKSNFAHRPTTLTTTNPIPSSHNSVLNPTASLLKPNFAQKTSSITSAASGIHNNLTSHVLKPTPLTTTTTHKADRKPEHEKNPNSTKLQPNPSIVDYFSGSNPIQSQEPNHKLKTISPKKSIAIDKYISNNNFFKINRTTEKENLPAKKATGASETTPKNNTERNYQNFCQICDTEFVLNNNQNLHRRITESCGHALCFKCLCNGATCKLCNVSDKVNKLEE